MCVCVCVCVCVCFVRGHLRACASTRILIGGLHCSHAEGCRLFLIHHADLDSKIGRIKREMLPPRRRTTKCLTPICYEISPSLSSLPYLQRSKRLIRSIHTNNSPPHFFFLLISELPLLPSHLGI